MAQILVIDDDPQICDMLCLHLQHMGYAAEFALTLNAGMVKLFSGAFDVVFLDVLLPDGDGLKAIPEIKTAPGSPEIIIFTAAGNPNGAELAIKSGAWDYVEKPLRVKELILLLTRTMQYRGAKTERRLRTSFKRIGILGSSPEIQSSIDLAAEAASSEESVLITGQTGAGKELFAQAIHENSRRSGKPFVVLDCTAIPSTLAASILFGHQKGSFTGADKHHTGVIKQADGGALFLDEVGELPLDIQAGLLRVLQERRFRPVGSTEEVSSDFRLLSASNRNLAQMVETGRFREDLYFRLKSLEIPLPPLKVRAKDTLEIALIHLRQLSETYGAGTKGVSPEFCEALLSYDWPGNVRELLFAIERAMVSSGNDPVLFPKHLPTNIRVKLARSSVGRGYAGETSERAVTPRPAQLPSLKEYRNSMIDEAEKNYLRQLVSLTGGSMRESCRISGLSQSRLYHLLKIHKLPRPKAD
ncbi:MAG: sigma-54-dependent Fis family transcriptional regulator [Deltaproteobacteria bacterium]|nr:sigma-54-dependent Fis family transcriptional regulator [Deltaproteobacteria bacterium]